MALLHAGLRLHGATEFEGIPSDAAKRTWIASSRCAGASLSSVFGTLGLAGGPSPSATSSSPVHCLIKCSCAHDENKKPCFELDLRVLVDLTTVCTRFSLTAFSACSVVSGICDNSAFRPACASDIGAVVSHPSSLLFSIQHLYFSQTDLCTADMYSQTPSMRWRGRTVVINFRHRLAT